jgi:TorA maturation chaperone TorD
MLPYATYYRTGFLHERPLARLRYDLTRLGIEQAPDRAEPEDHAAFLCEIMAGVTGRCLPAPPGVDRTLFEVHLAPWMGQFFWDLEQAEAATLYRSIGALGRLFMAIEAEAFALPG